MDVRIDKNTDFYKKINNFQKDDAVNSICIFDSTGTKDVPITIVIPTFKRAETLEFALQSSLNQSGFQSYRIIVIDNNPQRMDETEMLMTKYRNGKIAYFKNSSNIGMAGNCNRSVLLASSKWVVLLHDDDALAPDFLKYVYPILEKKSLTVLQTKKFDDWSNYQNDEDDDKLIKLGKLELFYSYIYGPPSGIVYNREKFLAYGGFNSDYYPSFDYCFHSFILSFDDLYILNRHLTFYRKEVNASQKIETQKLWIVVDYYLIRQMLHRYNIPFFIINRYLQYRTIKMVDYLRKEWKSELTIPQDYLLSIEYSKISVIICEKIVRFFSNIVNSYTK